jgi:hypothetical protein
MLFIIQLLLVRSKKFAVHRKHGTAPNAFRIDEMKGKKYAPVYFLGKLSDCGRSNLKVFYSEARDRSGGG